MSIWQADKKWSDRFLPEIKAILGTHLIGEPPIEEDAERNTDLMVLRMEAIRIGCRIRRHKFLAKYGNEFTIRAGRTSGVKTELTKIIEGWGDYFFYGFADAERPNLVAWFLSDLRVFRVWFNRTILETKKCPGLRQSNSDNSSYFLAFAVSDLPQQFVVARMKGAEPDGPSHLV